MVNRFVFNGNYSRLGNNALHMNICVLCTHISESADILSAMCRVNMTEMKEKHRWKEEKKEEDRKKESIGRYIQYIEYVTLID